MQPSEFLLLNISTAISHGSALAESALANPSGRVSGASLLTRGTFVLKRVQVRVVRSITRSPLTTKSPPTGNFRGADVWAEAQADAAAGARPSFWKTLRVRSRFTFQALQTRRRRLAFILGGFRIRRYRLRASEHYSRESSQPGGEREVSPHRPPKWLPWEPPSPCPDLTALPP